MSDSKKEKKGFNHSWLQRVSEQSWEPELLISGLAIFATLQLPGVVENFYQYYRFNYQVDIGIIDDLLPMLAVSVALTALKVLNFGFIFHFVVRAFWVGLIGLMSVFKDGIQYERLPNSELYKSEMEKRIGNQDSFLLATDRLASMVFSVSFLFVLYMIGVGALYIIFFLLMNGVKVFMPDDIFEFYSRVMLTALAVVLTLLSVVSLVLNMKRFREREKFAQLHFKLSWWTGRIFYPFIFRPIQYLILTFMSNLSSKKFQVYAIAVFVVFFTVFMKSFLGVLQFNPFESRSFYQDRSLTATYNPDFYESELEGGFLNEPTIQSPVINKGEMLSLFIPYMKMMDKKMEKLCVIEQPADSLRSFQRRDSLNQQKIDCANQFFMFVVNERDTLPSDLFFARHPVTDQAGYRGFFNMPDSLNPVKNQLEVLRQPVDDSDFLRDSLGRKLEFESVIPFWVQ